MTEPSPAIEDVELSVSFDINQLGPHLCWAVNEEDDHKRNLFSIVGRHAGAVHMKKGDRVYLRVSAYSGPLDGGLPGETSFEMRVVGCTLMTVPRLRQLEVLYTPSPFASGDAQPALPTAHFEKFEQLGQLKWFERLKATRLVNISTDHLDVAEDFGVWEFSMVLTVDITHQDGNEERRVFLFDPESEVGTGTQKDGL